MYPSARVWQKPMSSTAHLCIIDIMDFIENNEFNIPNQIRPAVKHTPENLSGHLKSAKTACISRSFNDWQADVSVTHDQARRLGIDLNVTRQNTDILRSVRVFEVPELLVRERFNR
jgi:hypothetical protein